MVYRTRMEMEMRMGREKRMGKGMGMGKGIRYMITITSKRWSLVFPI